MTAQEMPHVEHAGLYAVVEATPDPKSLQRLDWLLGEVAFASLLIVPASGLSLDADVMRPLVTCGQMHGVATLVADDPALAREVGADGVHLSWTETALETYERARAELGGSRIVGADAGASRDEAMRLGEAGADYVAFGLAHGLMADEEATSQRLDLVQWWAEIFEVPCVAFDVRSAADAHALSRAGADFLAFRVNLGEPQEDSARLARAMADALGAPASIA